MSDSTMRDENRKPRHEAIVRAAYALLAEKGYSGASMLSIARAAKASNETLYRWYGDKRGLFEAMVRDNAAEIKTVLEAAATADDPAEALRQFAPVFLTMILGERAILLNRAAASDPTGELGAAISAGGRNEIQPLIETLVARLRAPGDPPAADMTGWLIGLLVGDLQIRRVIGVMPPLSSAAVAARCDTAIETFMTLLRVSPK
ncbi:TetR/AcrR family transcriptional regulator [Acuticoccus sp. MNP-M23]|uniref:TetR/AcrR family transcriptional regulator n=1 Tax=Acuticoccus sp. MNP-M23 TaxID=3072793 RepID=UPI00281652A2|nr:TetR/AcrR family transcriptional regulator [Acuticoccus sp. MNP-M23]WMS44646.1 TetR/AcrR family transcriptional regulator [Acuticoccus sp. MNP-M23]